MIPIGNKILVKPLSKEDTTDSGIFLGTVDKKEKFLEKGTLIKKGARVKTDVSPGDTVYYDRWAGTVVLIDNISHLIMKDDCVVAHEI